jgi:hypothetical protein
MAVITRLDPTAPAWVRTPTIARRASGMIKIWCSIGIIAVGIAVSSWVRWIVSGQPHSPVALGPDTPSTVSMIVLRATEVLSTSVFIGLLWWSLVLPWRRHRTITVDGKLFIGGIFASACDVMISFFNPTWAFNAHAISAGTWANFFPLYGSPGQENLPWGLLWCLPAYIFLGLGAALVGSAMLRWLRAWFPAMTTVGLFGVVLLAFTVIAFALENIWIRADVYNYVSVPSSLTLWAGTTHQIPIYSSLLLGLYCLGFTWLRDSKDDDGRSAVERDIDDLPIGRRAKTVVSTLAVCGYTFVTVLVTYQVPWSWLAMKGNSHPVLPSYMRSGIYCGQPGEPLCAGEYLNRIRNDYRTPQR